MSRAQGDALAGRPAAVGRSRAVEGNARLTASVAVILIALLAAEGATLLGIGALLRPHVFIGFALIPPVALKILSTMYRFARYYTGDPSYRRKGPPHIVLRLLGPIVIILTVLLLGSGVALAYAHGAALNTVLFLHKASFVLWFGAMTAHVLGHIVETTRVAPRDWTRAGARQPVWGAHARRWSAIGSLAVGATLGLWGLTQFGPWAVHLTR